MLHFNGHQHLRKRLVLATLAGKPLIISDIRNDEDEFQEFGLLPSEVLFLQLLEQITNGSQIEISHTGTAVLYRPGVLVGGQLTFDCGLDMPMGYFLEPLLALAPFCKTPLDLSLLGVTNGTGCLSVDALRTVSLPLLKKMGLTGGDLELKIIRRGAFPLGGGEVRYRCPVVRSLSCIDLTDEGKIYRIRGVAYSSKLSPQTVNRMIEATRANLGRFCTDVYIYADVSKGLDSGKAPGYALCLVGESSTGVLLCAEIASQGGDRPEDIGTLASNALLTQIEIGGCVDNRHQWLAILFMVFSTEDVNRLRLGKLSRSSIQFLRDIRTVTGVTFKVEQERSNTVLLTNVGSGFVNLNKKTS